MINIIFVHLIYGKTDQCAVRPSVFQDLNDTLDGESALRVALTYTAQHRYTRNRERSMLRAALEPTIPVA
jgi:hypothetical protein